MTEHTVLIAGAGPTGMTLAAELALAGVDVALLEKATVPAPVRGRAGGLHARTLELFDQRGIADRFLAEGTRAQVAGFNMVQLDISDFPTRHNYGLAIPQNKSERILAEWVRELQVPLYRPCEVTNFQQDDRTVEVRLKDGRAMRAHYLVGCDGGRSTIRKAAGIDFPGWDPTTSWLIAEVEMTEEPPFGFRKDQTGIHAMRRTEEGPIGLVLTEPTVPTGEPTLSELKEALIQVYGTDFGAHSPSMLSRFNDTTRQAETYRKGRVLLAGDAAHVHPPLGGQGLNIGVHDAMNLGWKLARVVHGTSPESLLDTYQRERHPAAARVLRTTMAQVALRRQDERTLALGDMLGELLRLDETRKHLAAEISGLGLHYDLGPGHPLLGRRMPDLELGGQRVFQMLQEARPVLLNFGEPGLDENAIDVRYGGPWELPVLGRVPAPSAVLIRPDGYVAWAGDTPWPGISRALCPSPPHRDR